MPYVSQRDIPGENVRDPTGKFYYAITGWLVTKFN